MIETRALFELIMRSTQDQCREMGELFLSFAETPRDAAWRGKFKMSLASLPELPKSDLATTVAEARRRVAEEEDQLRATGWHPEQMRAKLLELGYTGASSPTDLAA